MARERLRLGATRCGKCVSTSRLALDPVRCIQLRFEQVEVDRDVVGVVLRPVRCWPFRHGHGSVVVVRVLSLTSLMLLRSSSCHHRLFLSHQAGAAAAAAASV